MSREKRSEDEAVLEKAMNGKFAQFCVRVKKRTEVGIPPPIPPNLHQGEKTVSGRKREWGHHVTCIISVEKLDDYQGEYHQRYGMGNS
ncbi:hypothetical protein TNCV_3079241 [Trichonephila clavipes]|nr:hypothetical protein TNCV_3079241 [Trichonephila clavipes]